MRTPVVVWWHRHLGEDLTVGRMLRASVAIVAHRGASARCPENTLSAVQTAVDLGADAVEVDVRLTADGALVVLHDASLARTTDARHRLPDLAPWNVSSLTCAQVRRVSAGAWWSAAYECERVPMLAEVLDLLAGTATGLVLEVKAPQLHRGIERAVAAELRRSVGFSTTERDGSRLVVQSFDSAGVRRLRAQLPDVTVGLLGHPPILRLLQVAQFADEVSPPYPTVDAEYVDAVHAAGLTTRVFTVNEPAEIRRLAKLGVDAVITDVPDVAATALSRRKKSTQVRAAQRARA